MPTAIGQLLISHGVLNDVLADHGLRQHVNVATHDRGHTLDLVVTADSYD